MVGLVDGTDLERMMRTAYQGKFWRRPVGSMVVACAVVAGSTSAWAGPASNEASVKAAWADEDPWAVVRSQSAPEAARMDAASRIVRAAGVAGSVGSTAREQIERAVAAPLDAGTPGRLILQAICRESEPSPKLFAIVAERLSRSPAATPAERGALLAAMSSFRTRESARMIMAWMEERQPADVVKAAATAMERLSGQALGVDADGWKKWFRSVEPLSEAEWRQRLIAGLSGRAERSATGEAAAEGRLVEMTRRLYLATSNDDRPAFLAELLLNDAPGQRALGFELVSRELASRGVLNGPVGQAAISLLSHGTASVRAQAAMLVRQLAPPGADVAVKAALTSEQDPTVASELLLAAGRWPTRSIEASLTRWLPVVRSGGGASGGTGSGAGEVGQEVTPVHRAAIEAAWMFYRAGELSPASVRLVLDQLRHDGVASMSPSGIQLFVAAGSEADWDLVAGLLEPRGESGSSVSAESRRAAAEALVWYPEYREAIVHAAESNQDLFEVASMAMWLGDPTAADMRRLLALPRVSNDASKLAISLTAARLSAVNLWEIIQETTDRSLRRSMLEELTRVNRVMSEGSLPEKREAIAEGAVELADERLTGGQADQALAVLAGCGVTAAMPSTGPTAIEASPKDPVWQARAEKVATAAMVALGKVAEASARQGDREAWWRGWGLLPADAPTRLAVASEMLRRFPEGWTEAQAHSLKSAMSPDK